MKTRVRYQLYIIFELCWSKGDNLQILLFSRLIEQMSSFFFSFDMLSVKLAVSVDHFLDLTVSYSTWQNESRRGVVEGKPCFPHYGSKCEEKGATSPDMPTSPVHSP